jgi:hypothetical protein
MKFSNFYFILLSFNCCDGFLFNLPLKTSIIHNKHIRLHCLKNNNQNNKDLIKIKKEIDNNDDNKRLRFLKLFVKNYILFLLPYTIIKIAIIIANLFYN